LGRLIVAVLAAIFGAALFHAYYLNLPEARRCRWDHPFDDSGRAACEQPAEGKAAGYSATDRRQLNSLIANVAD
jgi:hypothetical protein